MNIEVQFYLLASISVVHKNTELVFLIVASLVSLIDSLRCHVACCAISTSCISGNRIQIVIVVYMTSNIDNYIGNIVWCHEGRREGSMPPSLT